MTIKTISDLVSPGYYETLKATHAIDRKWGIDGKNWASEINYSAREIKAKSILDYGCGKGSLKAALTKLFSTHHTFIYEFDPGIIGKDTLPEPRDLVVATDVLEHIEPDKIAITLKYLRSLAIKGAFFVISLNPTKLILTDGRPAHLSLYPEETWLNELNIVGFDLVKKDRNDDVLIVWLR